MTDQNTPLRKLVNRAGYAFNMAIADTIRKSGTQQRWTCRATELPWSANLGKEGGFIDIVITRDRAIGVVETKKVNGSEKLVFLTRAGQSENVTRCRLNLYAEEQGPSSGTLPGFATREYGTVECNMVSGSPESDYCVAAKGDSANLNLDNIASDLLTSCEGLLEDLDLVVPGHPTACVPIIVTNATLHTCTFDPSQMDLGTGDIPENSTFKEHTFVRFRKAFRTGAGLNSREDGKHLEEIVEEGERTVFVVDSRHLVSFFAGLRMLTCDSKSGVPLQLVTG